MICPKCNAVIGKKQMNIQTDLAQCPSCEVVFRISEQLAQRVDDGFDIKKPPSGAWMNSMSDELVFGATTRSPVAFFMIPFMLVWSGMSLGGIYGSQISSGEFNIVMSLFGIPFVIGAVVFWGLTLLFIAGKVEVTLDRVGGVIFTGVGKIGLKKRFEWANVSTVVERKVHTRHGRKSSTVIELQGARRLSFGTFLNDSRRYYILRVLETILSKKKHGKSLL